MRKLVVFNNVTLDGYFADVNGDISWAHSGNDDAEFNAFVAENASGGGQLLLGRITYELMASFWPTPFAIENMPIVAEGMNSMSKVVFSRTLDQASWNNTKLVKGDIAAEIRKLKQEPGEGMRPIDDELRRNVGADLCVCPGSGGSSSAPVGFDVLDSVRCHRGRHTGLPLRYAVARI